MEFKLLEHCQLSTSQKKTERKRGVVGLKDLLSENSALQVLNRNQPIDQVNWTELFKCAHRALLLESECWKAEDQNKSVSSTVISNRENAKRLFSSLADVVLQKANASRPNVDFSEILEACFRVFTDIYLLKTCGEVYLGIMQANVLPVRKYRNSLTSSDWDKLFHCVLKFMESESELRGRFFYQAIELMDSVVTYSWHQSHLCLHVKGKLLPLLERKFISFYENVSLQEVVLKLAVNTCNFVAKESRTGVCHFGELILPVVLKMFKPKGDDKTLSRRLVVDFLLIQVQCHHPNGAKQDSGAAYACDWNKWTRYMHVMYRTVIDTISKSERNRHDPFAKNFLDLSVELFYQLLDKTKPAYDMSITMNETEDTDGGPAAKRRKWMTSTEELFEELQSCKRDSSGWPVLVLAILKKYPNMFQSIELLQLLQIMSEIQSNWQNQESLKHVNMCCEQLVKVLNQRGLGSDVLLKVWDTSLRAISSTQSEIHPLLQTLISERCAPTSGLQALVRMFQRHIVQLSDASLKTLSVLLSHHHIPESPGSDEFSCDPWDMPISSARVVLLDWLFSYGTDIVLDPKLVARVLVKLILRARSEPACPDTISASSSDSTPKDMSFEENHCVSAFEDRLLFLNPENSCQNHGNSNRISPCVVDLFSKNKLENLMQKKYLEIERKMSELQGEPPLTTAMAVVKLREQKVVLVLETISYSTLVVNVLSNLLVFSAVTNETLKDTSIYELLTKSMKHLSILLPDVLKVDASCVGSEKQLNNCIKVLQCLKTLYGSDLMPCLNYHLCHLTNKSILLTLLTFFTALSEDEHQNLDLLKNEVEKLFPENLFNGYNFTNGDNLQFLCAEVLTSFFCLKLEEKLHVKQSKLIHRLIQVLSDNNTYDLSRESTFILVHHCLSSVLSCAYLEPESHLRPIIHLLKYVCSKWKQDAVASSYNLCLLRGVFKHAAIDDDRKWERQASIILLTPFRNMKYGPKFTIEYISCFYELLKIDKDSNWARWNTSLNLSDVLESDTISSKASRKFEDEKEKTAVIEEIVFHLLSPFHEVRLVAVSIVSSFFCGHHHNSLWIETMFERLTLVLFELFIVKADDMTPEEAIDEGANRTSTVLHVLASIVAYSSKCQLWALRLIYCIMKRKNLDQNLIKKVFKLLATTMKLPSIQGFLEKSLPFILNEWLQWNYQLQDFPFILFNLTSFPDFFNKYKGSILPIILKSKTYLPFFQFICQEIGCPSTHLLEESFPSVYAQYLAFLVKKTSTSDTKSACKQYESIFSQLNAEKIRNLLSTRIDEVLFEITRLVWDSSHHEDLLGLDHSTMEPMIPFISSEEYSAAFKHLQRTIMTEQELLIYFVNQQPDILQKVLLQLREDISTSITVNQKVKGLHNYSAFVHAIALCLGRGDFPSLEEFLLSDITHTLLYLIQENKSNPVMVDVCIGSCCFLYILYHHLLPACSSVFINLLPTIVGSLIPLAVGSGALAEKSHKLLKLLVITHSSCLGDAIGSLPPFPESMEFAEMRKVHGEMKYKGNKFSLKEEIEHFLSSSSSTNTLANQNSMFDGLHFLRKELCIKKNELLLLYQDLKQGRGFSQDCKESILHQLICKLIHITSSANEKVQMEALRCLGELGPTDLTTLVLKPVEGCINLLSGYSDPVMCVMALAGQILSDYLLDYNINVVKAASQTLLNLMSCQKANALHSTKSNSKCIDSKKISPFIPIQPTKPTPSLSSDTIKLVSFIQDDEIWFPSGGIQHERWISRLASSLFCSLSDDDVFNDFASLCEVKTSFAEEMLPVLFYLGLNHSMEIGHQLCARLAQFFENHSNAVSLANDTILTEADSKNILLSKPSVQCMLNVVNFVRLKKDGERKKNMILKLNYLHVASAAQYCSAYLSSIMFLELWCNDANRLEYDGSGIPYIDFISECEPSNGKVLQNLLLKAYEQIGDNDAMYGCGSSILLNPMAKVNEYKLTGMWDKVLLNYDVKLSCSKGKDGVKGLVDSLHSSRLYHMLNVFVESQPHDQKDEFLSAQFECMWRLGQWNSPLSSDTKVKGFAWGQYSALQAVSDKNSSRVHECITEGRLCVLDNLAHSSLENCKNIYKPMSQLQLLKEIEDFVNSDDLLGLWNNWKNQDTLPHSDIFLLETTRAQRVTLLQIALKEQENHQTRVPKMSSSIFQYLTDYYLDTAELARKDGQIQIAEQWLHSLSLIPGISEDDTRKLRLQEAQLAWSSVKGLRDGTNLVARNLLRSLIKDVQVAEKESRSRSKLLPQALILYGKWMAETRSENPQQIIDDYLEEALQLLKDLPAHSSVQEQLEAHTCLAHFADLEYQRITSYIKSETFQKKVKCMEALQNESSLKVEKGNREQSSAVNFNSKYSALDASEIKNTYKDQDQFLQLAMRHYLSSMKLGEGTNIPVFRMVSLWLENSNKTEVNQFVKSELDIIQTYKFVELLPQIAARLGSTQDTTEVVFSKAIYKLLMRCCIEHPYHTLPLILALANSYEDFEGKVKPDPEPRVVSATRMIEELRRDKSVGKLVAEMDKLSKALVSLAYVPVPDQDNPRGFIVPKNEKIRQMQNLQYAMLPIVHLPVQSDAKYNNIISIQSFDSKYFKAGGINRPKKIICIGSDGVKRLLLVKGRDDLRQDAVMQQVFNIVNTLLQAHSESKRRRLKIRTYKIVPLSQRCGVLEWCQNTSPAMEIFMDVHSRYCPTSYKNALCMKKIEDARLKSPGERLSVFKEICKNVHPAFRFFFIENYSTPAEWFDHRMNYVHSVATNSMVGYILGLGDRHPNNILIDKSTGELVHIDFGIAFEQGKVLPTPETVPFRLTRDIVDGMGISGVEGVFRRSCEKTMGVLRQNQEKILTILEVLLYDPLYQWTITPKMAAKCQKENSQDSIASDSDEKVNTSQKNKMAVRVLCRLKEKLQGTEEGPVSSIEGQVNRLIQQARDLGNLSRLFRGWQAYF